MIAGTRAKPKSTKDAGRIAIHIFLILTCLVWIAPLLWSVFASLRTYADTAEHGYFSWPSELTLSNFGTAWAAADLPHYFLNTLLMTVPSVLIVLLFSSMAAFVVSRYSFRFNLLVLMVFTAGNLLPQQVIITPLYHLYRLLEVPEWLSENESLLDTQLGLVLIHVAFQSGFCTFVLSNYMKTIPHELTEVARIDGAGVLRQYCR